MPEKMKRVLRRAACLFFLAVFLGVSAAGAEGDQKLVRLRDGTVLRGTVVPSASGVFLIKTQSLGEVQVAPDDILSVETLTDAYQEDKGRKIQELKSDILGNQEAMASVRQLAENDEIAAIMSDEELQAAIFSLDFEALDQSPKFQAFANHPDVQALVRQIRNKKTGAQTDER